MEKILWKRKYSFTQSVYRSISMNAKQLTKKIAHIEAIRRDELAHTGYFDNSDMYRTANIEQEVQVLDSRVERAGMPISAVDFFQKNSIGARPDTSVFIVEYDGSALPVEINLDGIKSLAHSFLQRTQYIQDSIPKGAILVPIGANPVLKASESTNWLVKDEQKHQRYLHIDANAYVENPHKKTNIINPYTGMAIRERASSIKGMFRVTGTQLHISENNIEDALDSHRTSIAIAPCMVAIFGNSPFLAGIDTGMSSSRIELLCQTEQLRSGLPKPAHSLLDYYEDILILNSPFDCPEDGSKALDLAVSAVHTVSRIRVVMDEGKGNIRNEFRHIDSQSPFRSMQAFLLTLGSVEAFRHAQERPEYEYSCIDFKNAVWGQNTQFHWNKKAISVQELGVYIIDKAVNALEPIGLASVAHTYLDPLQEEIRSGMTQSDHMRNSYYSLLKLGASKQEALVNILKTLNRNALCYG